MADSLWGEEFNSPVIVKKSRTKVKTACRNNSNVTNKKVAPKLNKEEQLSSITSEVNRILGVYEESTITIKSIEEFN